jgi:hypothetical protein
MTKEQIVAIYGEIISKKVFITISDEPIEVLVVGFIDDANVLKMIDEEGHFVFIDGASLDFIGIIPTE